MADSNISKLIKKNRFSDEKIDKEFQSLIDSINSAFDIINERNEEVIGTTNITNTSQKKGTIAIPKSNETETHAVLKAENSQFDVPIAKKGSSFSIPYNIVNVTTVSYTVLPTDRSIFVTAVPGSTITLPKASTITDKEILIKKIDTSINNITITPYTGELIDNAATVTISSAYSFVRLQSDGQNWWTV